MKNTKMNKLRRLLAFRKFFVNRSYVYLDWDSCLFGQMAVFIDGKWGKESSRYNQESQKRFAETAKYFGLSTAEFEAGMFGVDRSIWKGRNKWRKENALEVLDELITRARK